MFFRRSQPPAQSELEALVAKALPDADADTRQIVVAISGLLGCVSYADRDFSDQERATVERLLQSINGLRERDARAITQALHDDIVNISTVEAPRFARTLKQKADRDLRLHVLGLLLEVAAGDEDLAHTETVVLRQLTTSLGLEQSDYNDLQSAHRQALALLKGDS